MVPLFVGVVIVFALIQLTVSGFIVIKQKQINSLNLSRQKLAPEKKELDKIKTIKETPTATPKIARAATLFFRKAFFRENFNT